MRRWFVAGSPALRAAMTQALDTAANDFTTDRHIMMLLHLSFSAQLTLIGAQCQSDSQSNCMWHTVKRHGLSFQCKVQQTLAG
jgi:hypothetical protein